MQTNGREKNTPPPTQEPWGKHRENTARGPHPPRGEKKKTRGKRGKKTRQGEPHQPREKRKAPLDAKKNNKIPTKSPGEHLDDVAELGEAHAQRQASRSRRQKANKNNKNKTHHLLSSVSLPKPRRPKRNSRCDDAHPPRDPKTEKTESLIGPKLKGQPNQNKSPKATDLSKFPKQSS